MTTAPSSLADGLVRYDAASRDRFRRAGWWSGHTLPADLVAALTAHARRVGLVTADGSWTYGRLLAEATAFAGGLGALADAPLGSPVMFQMGNVAETVVAYLGCLLAGRPPVCTLPQHGPREIALLAQHVGARCLVSQADFRGGRPDATARALLADGTISSAIVARGAAFPGARTFEEICGVGAGVRTEELPYTSLDPDQIAVFQLSGGTTGLPKVAARLHEEYAYNSRAWADALDYTSESVLLYPLPVMHNAGISLAVQPAILSGARLVLAASADVEEILGLIEQHGPDVLPLVPPALAIRLLDSGVDRSALAGIRDFVVGGQKLPEEVAERLRDELGVAVRQMFGMAEGMFLVTPRDAGEDVRHHTVGRPISPGDEIRVLDPVTGDEVAPGEIGELTARGPYTIRGYYRADAHNRAAFTPDGFYRTGDLARVHVLTDGVSYSIEGRIKDVINRGVEKIHAEEVEELIVQHPAVRTAALVAMPDRVLGEKACAYIVLEDRAAPVDVATLGAFLLEAGLAKYKLPERVEVVDVLPLTNVGKVSKKDLRDDIQRKVQQEAR